MLPHDVVDAGVAWQFALSAECELCGTAFDTTAKSVLLLSESVTPPLPRTSMDELLVAPAGAVSKHVAVGP
jgi:hypothetical protein